MTIPLFELQPASQECLRWRPGGRHSWRHLHEGGFDADRYMAGPVAETVARRFVTRLHYSGTWPAVRLPYGMWDMRASGGSPRLVGVAALSVPVSRRVLTNVFPTLEPYAESLELGRFVLADDVPGNGETWFLAEVLRLAGQAGVRGVVSFADPMPRSTLNGRVVFPGHRGAIYQAATARYLGRATRRRLVLLPDGTVLSARTVQKIRRGEPGWEYGERTLVRHGATPRRPGEDRAEWLARALGQARARSVRHPGNHRYALLAGTKAQKRRVRVCGDVRPYPKDARRPVPPTRLLSSSSSTMIKA